MAYQLYSNCAILIEYYNKISKVFLTLNKCGYLLIEYYVKISKVFLTSTNVVTF